jgi:oligoribonuclease NrnB/cAMP/cGMP phosphodiesterase (DHH superfamily)
MEERILRLLTRFYPRTTFINILNSTGYNIDDGIAALKSLEQDGYITTLEDNLMGSNLIKLKVVIIYHLQAPGIDCSDGIAGAWVCQRYYQDAEVIGACYGTNLDYIKAGLIVLVDFSVAPEQVNRWTTRGIKVLIIDHHKTAFEQFSISNFSNKVVQGREDRMELTDPLFTGEIDISSNYSGASLAWEVFNLGKVPFFLQYIADADNWHWRLKDSRAVNTGLSHLRGYHKSLKDKFAFFDLLYEVKGEDKLLNTLRLIGEVIISNNEEIINQAVARWQEMDILSYKVPCVKLETTQEEALKSGICEKLYTDPSMSHYPFVACLMKDEVSFTLRSSKQSNFDVATLAKTVGGGGHPNAAGFKLKTEEDKS